MLICASYYINPPGVSHEEACVWGTKDKPIGNVGPLLQVFLVQGLCADDIDSGARMLLEPMLQILEKHSSSWDGTLFTSNPMCHSVMRFQTGV
jgi:hypothetical protein